MNWTVGLRNTIAISVVALVLGGCANASWMRVNCGWANDVLPIKPSRADRLTTGTKRQIVVANEAHGTNCR